MQVADDGDVGRDPRGGLVERREVVEVQHVGLARRRPSTSAARPRADLLLELRVVERRETSGPAAPGRSS